MRGGESLGWGQEVIGEFLNPPTPREDRVISEGPTVSVPFTTNPFPKFPSRTPEGNRDT